MRSGSFKVAAVQAAPVLLDLDATVEKACSLIGEAASNGAKLVVFPECFLPGYPLWCWRIPAGESKTLRKLYAELLANSVTIPSESVTKLCDAAREHATTVVMGVNECNSEASGTTLYNSLVYISDKGTILGKHRKLVPTGGERLIYGQGDGSTLDTFDLPIGRLGGLICWENYMPLARYSLYAAGVQLYVAPTWDNGEPWLSSLRHIAKEGRAWVIGCATAIRKSDLPSRLGLETYFTGSGEWINPGESMIVDPDGKIAAGPVREEEIILYADVDPATLTGPRSQLDVAGHYARPDVFTLSVNREERKIIQ
ncbi:MAG: carbon-nitrogen hydrolase family protein [Gemmatimonadaceae bacterium]